MMFKVSTYILRVFSEIQQYYESASLLWDQPPLNKQSYGLKQFSTRHCIILGNVRISRNFARDNAVLDNGVYGWDDKSAFVNTGNWPNVLPELSHRVPKLMYQQQPVVGGGGLLRVGWRELVGGLEL